MITNRLMKNCVATATHGQGRVGRRVASRSTAAALSDRNDGQRSFSAALKSSPTPFSLLSASFAIFVLKIRSETISAD
jgi:hypothetical protein